MNETAMPRPWFRRFNNLTAVFAILCVLALLLSAPGYKFGLIPLKTAFSFALAGGALALASSVSGLLALIIGRNGQPKVWGKASFVGIAIGGALLAQLGSWASRSDPKIHDISTDLDNPPPFVAIAPLRADAPNPVEYTGGDTAKLQREAYPDLASVRLNAKPADVIDAAKAAAEAAGWEIVSIDRDSGRLEATETTFWYGYKDDIVVRVLADGGDSRLDVRSKSRVGLSDLRTNAARIRNYIAAIKKALPTS